MADKKYARQWPQSTTGKAVNRDGDTASILSRERHVGSCGRATWGVGFYLPGLVTLWLNCHVRAYFIAHRPLERAASSEHPLSPFGGAAPDALPQLPTGRSQTS